MPTFAEIQMLNQRAVNDLAAQVHELEVEEGLADARMRDIETQMNYLREVLLQHRAELSLKKQAVCEARFRLRMAQRKMGEISSAEEAAVLDHMRALKATSPGNAVNIIQMAYPLSMASHRQVEPYQMRPLVKRLIREGKILSVGNTRGTRYWLSDVVLTPPPPIVTPSP